MLDERLKIGGWDLTSNINSVQPQEYQPSSTADPTSHHSSMFDSVPSSSLENATTLPSLVEPSSSAAALLASHQSAAALRTGRWTQDEKLLFLLGLKRFGKGRWKKMSVYLPHRSLVQIKSHAQKVIKRQEAGEDIFQKLDDATPQLVESLVLQAAQEREALRAAGVNVNTTKPSKSLLDAAKKSSASKSTNNKRTTPNKNKFNDEIERGPNGTGGPESVIAAAALCQLSSVGTPQQWDQLDPLDVMPMINQQANV
ncbi:Myb-like DNA-binding protein [Nitzschia inconspicua]|uniref:Myb-like DNA-binding protein n=1 Tax=Nitzschia inconspicua TaxID=303405 RepID=A0A9K3PIT5_9STRA|nr:Myb-like DNA-binding protein [Nitzschia inconspicua]